MLTLALFCAIILVQTQTKPWRVNIMRYVLIEECRADGKTNAFGVFKSLVPAQKSMVARANFHGVHVHQLDDLEDSHRIETSGFIFTIVPLKSWG